MLSGVDSKPSNKTGLHMDASSLVSPTKSTVMTSGMVTYSPNEDTMAKSFWRNLFGHPSSASSSDTGALQEYWGFGHEDGW